MSEIQICFIKPKPGSLVGKVICWRTGDVYHHSFIVVNGVKYDPTWPKVSRTELKDQPVVADEIFTITCDEDEQHMLQRYLEQQVGSWYDWLALIGWLVEVKQIEYKVNYYCHEFCREALVLLGKLPPSDDLIRARGLIGEIAVLK